MVFHIHSDASYLSEPRARSRLAEYCFLGNVPILWYRAHNNVLSRRSSAWRNIPGHQEKGKALRLALSELSHSQQPIPVHCANSTAAGTVNDSVKKQRSHSTKV